MRLTIPLASALFAACLAIMGCDSGVASPSGDGGLLAGDGGVLGGADAAATQSIAAHYHVTMIPELLNGGATVPTGVNAANTVIGYSTMLLTAGYPKHAFRYDDATGLTTDIAGDKVTTPNGINDDGTIVGVTADGTTGMMTAGLVWQAGATAPSSTLEGAPAAINNNGIVVGSGGGRGLVWDLKSGAAPTVLQNLYTTSRGAKAMAVSSRGQIGGMADDDTHYDQAVLWATPTSAPSLQETAGAYSGTQVLGLNASGVMVGVSGSNPVIWPSDGAAPESFGFGTISAINDGGIAVGTISGSPGHGVIWSRAAGLQAFLPLLDAESATAWSAVAGLYAISSTGVVVGTGIFSDHLQHAFIAKPVP